MLPHLPSIYARGHIPAKAGIALNSKEGAKCTSEAFDNLADECKAVDKLIRTVFVMTPEGKKIRDGFEVTESGEYISFSKV